jgi:hypothetical protein
VQATQVPRPPTYCKNHHEGLHHYEHVVWSRISSLSNGRLDTSLAEQWISKARHHG